MKNKVIAVISACVIIINCMTLPVSAIEEIGESVVDLIGGQSQAVGDALRVFWTTVGDVVNGDKTFAEAKDTLVDGAEEIGNDLIVNYITNIDPNIQLNTTEFLKNCIEHSLAFGDSISDFVLDIFNIHVEGSAEYDFSDGEGGLIRYMSDTTTYYYTIYDGVIRIKPDGHYWLGFGYTKFVQDFGKNIYESYDSSTSFEVYDLSTLEFFGDWTVIDERVGSEEVIDYGDPDVLPPTIDDATDEQLIDILNDLINTLNMAFPDLSTVEGLLNAILAQCISINGKMDNISSGLGVADMAELKVMLDMSIASLIGNNNNNNEALLEELVAIRKDLAFYYISDITEEQLQDDVFLNDIIDRLINSLSLFNISLFDVPSLDDVRELGTDGVKLLSKVVDLIVSISSMVPLNMVNTLFGLMHAVMFNDLTPADLTFNITLDGQTTTYTLLSASLLEKKGFTDALSIIRALSTFIILYIWLKWARKYFVSFV